MEVSGQLHDPAALPPGKRPLYPLVRRLGPLGRWCKWVDNIILDLREKAWGGGAVAGIHQAQKRHQLRLLMNTVSVEGGKFLDRLSDY
jgi:hypothetical protein